MIFAEGDKVFWKWLGRDIEGVVLEIFKAPISKVIKGKTIKRNGSPENPAYLVESNAGNTALKLATELHSLKKKANKESRPKMFSSN